MEIGQLNRRIELIACQRADDGAGGYTRADISDMEVWGNIKPASWSQQQHAERLEQRVTHTITIRWRADLAYSFGPEARARVIDAGGRVREFAVKTAIDPNDKRNWLQLGCIEGGPL